MSKLQVKNVLVLGAGKVGSTVADMVAEYHRWYASAATMLIPETHKRLTRPSGDVAH